MGNGLSNFPTRILGPCKSTNIPILPEKDLYDLKDQPSVILNLAWHLPKEVRKNLEKNGYKGSVIDIKEFKFLT